MLPPCRFLPRPWEVEGKPFDTKIFEALRFLAIMRERPIKKLRTSSGIRPAPLAAALCACGQGVCFTGPCRTVCFGAGIINQRKGHHYLRGLRPGGATGDFADGKAGFRNLCRFVKALEAQRAIPILLRSAIDMSAAYRKGVRKIWQSV